MNSGFPLRTAFKIAWRESRASSARFLFVILAVAVGTGSLVGVRGFSRAFGGMLLREARTLMAADLSVRVFEMPTPPQEELFVSLAKRGIRRTQITETVTMLGTGDGSAPMLVSLKAVDPRAYPFYGQVTLDPPGNLQERLKPDVIAVSEDLLLRTNLKVGDRVHLGSAEFTIGGVVTQEPDRMAGSLNVGPRVMISREGLERTELLRPGSRAAQRHLFKLPVIAEGMTSVEEVRNELKDKFPNSLIADFRETHPLIRRGLERSTRFLSLVSLIALIVGALGVATAMQSHLQQKLDSIAVMKSIGARSGQIMRIYSVQGIMLAFLGSAVGIALGAAVQFTFPALIARYFPVAPRLGLDWVSVLEGLGVGMLSTVLFIVPPLLGIRRIRPGVILRREMAESRDSLAERLRNLRAPAFAAILILCGIGLIAAFLIGGEWDDALEVGAWFVGGLLVSVALMALFSWGLLRGLRMLVRTPIFRVPASIRHGVANLYRPGNHAQTVLVALGVGVMFTLTVYLIQHSVLAQIIASAPPGMPNVFLINVTEQERGELLKMIESWPGVQNKPSIISSVGARIVSVDGRELERSTLEGPARRYLRTRAITSEKEIPENTQIIEGAWWTQWDPAHPSVSVAEEAARLLQLKIGSEIQWEISGRMIRGRVAAIHKTESVRPGSSIEFILSPGALNQFPALFYGGVRMTASEIPKFQRASFERFPAVTVINVADVLDRIQEVVDQIALVVRFISAFAILAGVIILASSVAGTRFRRIREVVILKTLGATRRRVAGIFSVEFLLLGLAAGIMGSVLASGFSNLILKRLLDSDYRFDPVPNLVAILLTAAIANLAGWLASFRILQQKPLEALRNE